MRCRIIQLSRAGSATRLAREVSIEAHSLRIGRGTGNEIFLPDPRVALHAASIFTDDDGLRLVATGSQAIELNGTPVPGARLHDYAKAPRQGRKLGHVTITGPDMPTVAERARRVSSAHPRASSSWLGHWATRSSV